MKPLTQPEIFSKVSREVASRIGTSLHKKLTRGYHNLPQCAGKPLVLMFARFFGAGSVFYSDDALLYLLFGGPQGWSNEIFPRLPARAGCGD